MKKLFRPDVPIPMYPKSSNQLKSSLRTPSDLCSDINKLIQQLYYAPHTQVRIYVSHVYQIPNLRRQ